MIDEQRPMAFDDRALHGKRILFWASEGKDVLSALAEVFVGAISGTALLRPERCINPRVSLRKRQLVAKLLAAGEPIESYFGHAHCRLCGAELGHRDLAGYGFIWPDKAEHYLLEHDVWTPDCDRLFAAARRN